MGMTGFEYAQRMVKLERIMDDAVRCTGEMFPDDGISSSDRNHISAATLISRGYASSHDEAWELMREARRFCEEGRRLFEPIERSAA